MRPIDILSQAPRILSQTERQFYFDEGYVVQERAIDNEWLNRLNTALSKLVDRSRNLTSSDGTFDLEIGHTVDTPRLRRIAYLDDLDQVFWEFCSNSVLADIAADLMGSNVRFRECLINFKWAHGGQQVEWHQDIPFYPHTNLSPAQFLICLDDVGSEQGPLQVVPRSHLGPIFDHYDDAGNWLGHIPDTLIGGADVENAVELTGPAGTVTVHNCATVHGSKQNLSARGRPVLIVGYSSCDALPYTAPAYPSSNLGTVVRGEETKFAQHDPVSLRLPPDWSSGYTSIFAHQAKANAK